MTTTWRPLTEAEAEAWSKARLGGALLGLTIVNGVLTLVLAIVLFLAAWAVHRTGLEAAFRGLGADPHGAVTLGLINAAAVLALLVWAVVVFALTLARARATPVVASVGAVLLFLVEIAARIATQWLIMTRTGGDVSLALFTFLPQIPVWVGSLAMTIALVGYFVGGVRPNAYFRRRVAVPGSDPE